MIVVLIGPSGAGKGTQADRLVHRRPFLHIATGDLFRESLRRRTALGRRVKKYLDSGELVPEEITEAVVRQRLEQIGPDQSLLLDGYPRTEAQAGVLEETISKLGRNLEAAIYLKIADRSVIERRIDGRLTCRGCERPYHPVYRRPQTVGICDECGGRLYRRSDDTPPWARIRLRVFHRQTAPVVDHYQKAGKLIVLDGSGTIEEVGARLDEVLDALEQHRAHRATPEESQAIQDLREPPRTIAAGDVCYLTLDVVLLGAPGSGKGTQAEALRRRFGLIHVATGDLFREHLREETELGQLARTYMDRGELVPDGVTEGMVRERLASPDVAEGFILDGFPRTLPQAEALTDILTDLRRRLRGVLYIRVPDRTIIDRLSGRWICRKCQTPYHERFRPPATPGICDECGGELYQRDDDRPKTVRARLRTFRRQTAPLIEHYRRTGQLVEIDGEGEVAEVTKRTIAAVERLRGPVASHVDGTGAGR